MPVVRPLERVAKQKDTTPLALALAWLLAQKPGSFQFLAPAGRTTYANMRLVDGWPVSTI
jgi:aryl-alcohol dehydrogenase-like predicted oxidoreductase